MLRYELFFSILSYEWIERLHTMFISQILEFNCPIEEREIRNSKEAGTINDTIRVVGGFILGVEQDAWKITCRYFSSLFTIRP